MKRKIGITATAACIAAGVFGASSASALTLTTGLQSPKGTNVVAAPESATGGALNAFTQVNTHTDAPRKNLLVTP